jgi:hypothetical protein
VVIFGSTEANYLQRIYIRCHMTEEAFPEPDSHLRPDELQRSVVAHLAGSAGYVFLAQTIAMARPGRRVDELYGLILESFVVNTRRAQRYTELFGWSWPEVAGTMMNDVDRYFRGITPGTFLGELEYAAGSKRDKLRAVRERAFTRRFGAQESWKPSDDFWIEMSHATA